MAKLPAGRPKDALDTLAGDIEKSFGRGSAARGGLQKALNTIPSGSLALDYELGIGGWPLGYLVGIFGEPEIGKSTILGFSAISNAQAMGLNCAIIAMEPNFDEAWAAKNGVKVDDVLVAYPQNGEEAFSMLLKIVKSGAVDFVLFDSIGAIISEKEMEDDGKARVGGQAGLITRGVKATAPVAYRHNVCVMFINQIRDDMNSPYGGKKQPGGHALEHHESIIVELKRGPDRYTVKRNGTDVLAGRKIVAHIKKNKMAEGTGNKAVFDHFAMETEEYPFGIDLTSDVINTAKRVGVIKSRGSWLDLPNGESFNGFKAVSDYLDENPLVLELVREKVLKAMLDRNVAMLEITGELVEELAAIEEEEKVLA